MAYAQGISEIEQDFQEILKMEAENTPKPTEQNPISKEVIKEEKELDKLHKKTK
jgi:hypothetical protein